MSTVRIRLDSSNGGTSETQAIIGSVDEEQKNEQNEKEETQSHEKARFLWLDKCLLYFPMCTSLKPFKTHNKKKLIQRNKYWIACIIIISILLCILLLTSSIANLFDDDMLYYLLNDLLFEVCQITFKLFSLHYFYSFNFPWYSHIEFSFIKCNDAITNQQLWPHKMAKMFIILMSVVYIPYLALHAYFGHTETSVLEENAFVSIVSDVAFAYFWWFPITFSFTVHTVLCVKYKYYLSQIVSCIKLMKQPDANITITLKQVILDYESLYAAFKNEYASSLQSATLSFLLGTILYFWGFFFHFQIKNDLDVSMEYMIISALYGVIGSLLMIIMYTVPASYLNAERKKLEKELWHIHSDEWKFSMHFLDFIKKYFIGIRIGKFVVTYKNVVCFFIVFGITKYITFSVRSQTK